MIEPIKLVQEPQRRHTANNTSKPSSTTLMHPSVRLQPLSSRVRKNRPLLLHCLQIDLAMGSIPIELTPLPTTTSSIWPKPPTDSGAATNIALLLWKLGTRWEKMNYPFFFLCCNLFQIQLNRLPQSHQGWYLIPQTEPGTATTAAGVTLLTKNNKGMWPQVRT